ncbi:hypothetical protein DFS34DRAFT_654240 [Phlyctochytrium arcticum]|nr:hypothetical protein DFS34DRAFT_654240 [Phlyctochytrium arcticum]
MEPPAATTAGVSHRPWESSFSQPLREATAANVIENKNIDNQSPLIPVQNPPRLDPSLGPTESLPRSISGEVNSAATCVKESPSRPVLPSPHLNALPPLHSQPQFLQPILPSLAHVAKLANPSPSVSPSVTALPSPAGGMQPTPSPPSVAQPPVPVIPKLQIKPDHYYEPDGVPVFKPTMEEFVDFQAFVHAIEPYGMVAGIVKIVPPKEWLDKLPNVTKQLEGVRIKKPIMQDFTGGGLPAGAYRQMNLEQRRTYTVQDWYDVANDSVHRPPQFDDNGKQIFEKPQRSPARKRQRKSDPLPAEEVRLSTPMESVEESAPATDLPSDTPSDVQKRDDTCKMENEDGKENVDVNPTAVDQEAPTSPKHEPPKSVTCVKTKEEILPGDEKSPREPAQHDNNSALPTPEVSNDSGKVKADMGSSGPSVDSGTLATSNGAEPKEPSQKLNPRKRSIAESVPSGITFDLKEVSGGFSDAYCEALERHYWRNLPYVSPMYGADMLGSLFNQILKKKAPWNLAHLNNLLRRVNVSLPGVNSPYLYWGMWKATFAWHVEDMDLYSINYIHFGAPKQWYVIPPAHRSKFELVARGVFGEEANNCAEFLRHKTCVLSPKFLKARNLPVNRVVQRAGEFVITFPYGYHQGFNLGFNCAESVNFAMDRWVEIGKQAGYCECVGDSVKLDVAGLFDPPAKRVKKLKIKVSNKDGSEYNGTDSPLSGRTSAEGTETPEGSSEHGAASPTLKKRGAPKKDKAQVLKEKKERERKERLMQDEIERNKPRCVLCTASGGQLLGTDCEYLAHKRCAEFVPETWIENDPNDPSREIIKGIMTVDKARWRLKCAICKPKKGRGDKGMGACIQCVKGKCTRAYHVSCAFKHHLLIEEGDGRSCYCMQHHPNRREILEIIKNEEARESTPEDFSVPVPQPLTPTFGRQTLPPSNQQQHVVANHPNYNDALALASLAHRQYPTSKPFQKIGIPSPNMADRSSRYPPSADQRGFPNYSHSSQPQRPASNSATSQLQLANQHPLPAYHYQQQYMASAIPHSMWTPGSQAYPLSNSGYQHSPYLPSLADVNQQNVPTYSSQMPYSNSYNLSSMGAMHSQMSGQMPQLPPIQMLSGGTSQPNLAPIHGGHHGGRALPSPSAASGGYSTSYGPPQAQQSLPSLGYSIPQHHPYMGMPSAQQPSYLSQPPMQHTSMQPLAYQTHPGNPYSQPVYQSPSAHAHAPGPSGYQQSPNPSRHHQPAQVSNVTPLPTNSHPSGSAHFIPPPTSPAQQQRPAPPQR